MSKEICSRIPKMKHMWDVRRGDSVDSYVPAIAGPGGHIRWAGGQFLWSWVETHYGVHNGPHYILAVYYCKVSDELSAETITLLTKNTFIARSQFYPGEKFPALFITWWQQLSSWATFASTLMRCKKIWHVWRVLFTQCKIAKWHSQHLKLEDVFPICQTHVLYHLHSSLIVDIFIEQTLH